MTKLCDKDEAAHQQNRENRGDPAKVFVDDPLDRRTEQAEQYSHRHEDQRAPGDTGQDESYEVHLDEARRDRQQLERNRRAARQEDYLPVAFAQDARRLGEGIGKPDRIEKRCPHRIVEEIADGIAEQPAQDRKGRRHCREAERFFGFGQTHQTQQRVRGDGKKARFDKTEKRQPPHRMGVCGLGHGPVVQPAKRFHQHGVGKAPFDRSTEPIARTLGGTISLAMWTTYLRARFPGGYGRTYG